MEDATSKFFNNGKCEFDSDVLHIHVDHIEQNHCLIAIATEFGQIKVFEVKNYNKHHHPHINSKNSGGGGNLNSTHSKHSEFREYLSGNISSNVCKIQLFLTPKPHTIDFSQADEEEAQVSNELPNVIESSV